ncbi:MULTISPECIES: LPXTG cell wall anchor domain-containing protein [Brevibacterium]|uniref:LPXTG-motif cell wall anchor domain-containing protein n=1 Tax=Brevibacterium aurantiacum TaxID=273384 RepID=A0A2H1J8U0_BREAU|nr:MULTISPECIES: HtaA domain-containing protein [Brevibacterium]TGD10661.1 LPXTG cell wall anchor domain-containing protein [Brevibacterium sp. S111]SMX83813.1 LPXTG-motif cell wall anchor domain-containing protein [Brevibacterium aurantiacum]
MTHKSARARAGKARRFTSPLAAGAAIAAATGLLGMGMSAPAFGAVDKTVDDAVFNWSVNDESTGGAYFGGCNFLIAGEAGDTGMARIWTADDAGTIYPVDDDGNFTDGNTSIVKTNGKASNFADRCTDGDGNSVNGKVNAEAENNHTGDHIEIANGTGTVDPDKDSASIQWEGSWSFAYYGGMTYWTISDPKLEVKDGKGTITGTYSGFGADMDDLSIWKKLDARDGDIVEIQQGEVDVTDDGFEFTPDYLGVETDTDGRNLQSEKTAENESWWGAMPQDWIDFNVETGQDSYWYTTAGASTSIQPRKKTNPLTVEYTAQAPAPKVSTSHSVKSASADDGLTVNVTGDGYDNLPEASTGKPSAGAYAAIVDRDLASKDVTAGNTTAVQYVMPPQIKDGTIDVDVNAKATDLDESKDYDVLTWVAHGLPTGDAELYREPIDLTDEQKNALFPGEDDEDDAAADGAEAGDDGAADGAEGDNDGAEGTDEGAADAAEGEADGAEGTDDGAADAAEGEADDNAAEGDTDGAESDDEGAADAAEGDDNGAADAAEGDNDGAEGAADAAEGNDDGAADAAEGDADGSDSDAGGAADGDDSDGGSDGDEDKPAKPVVKDQTVGKDRLVKGTTTPNAEVNLAWTPVVDKDAGSQVKAFAATVPAEDNVTVTADGEGNFSAKAPSAKGTYAYSAITTVDGVPSDPAEFTVTVNEDEAADDDAGSAGDSDGGSADGAGDNAATDGAEAGSDSGSSASEGAADGAEADASGSDDSAGSGSAGSGSAGSSTGGSASGGSDGSNLPRTGADLMTLPIALGLIILGAGSVLFSRMRKR